MPPSKISRALRDIAVRMWSSWWLLTEVWKEGLNLGTNRARKCQNTLPESQALPSAKNFTEYFISGTRQRMSLPSIQTRTLDKDTTLGKAALCRVLRVDTRQRRHLCRVLSQRLTLGKFWPAVKPACRRHLFAECTKATLDKEALCRVSKADTRQSIIFFYSCTSKFFTSPHTTCGTPCLSLVYFWIYLLYLTN